MGTREMKDSGIEWIGEIPKDWEVCRLKVLCTIKSGESLSKELIKEYGYFPVFGGGAECLGFHNLSNTNSKDIIIGRVGAKCGCVTLPECDCWATDNALILQSSLHLKFTYFLLSGFDLNRLNVSNAQPLITSSKIKESYVCFPSIVEQHRIATFLDEKCKEIDTLITLQEEMIAELQAYKQSVISETVTKGLNPNVTMKDSGVEWIGEIPKDWEIRKMKKLCSFINGDRSNNYPSPEDFADSGIPFCGADSLNKIHVDLENVRYISIMKYNQMGGLKINYGDILYTLRGSTIGKNAIALFNNGTVASSLMGIRANNQFINSKFLVFWLNSKLERFQREICINGSTAPNLSAANVGEFIIPVPPFSEQQAIADYLDTKCAQIDELIALKQQKITELQDYKKSLIYEYVTGKKEVPANN